MGSKRSRDIQTLDTTASVQIVFESHGHYPDVVSVSSNSEPENGTVVTIDRNSSSMDQARASVAQLTTLVKRTLEDNEEMSQRITEIETQSPSRSSSVAFTSNDSDTCDDESMTTVRPIRKISRNVSVKKPERSFDFAFEKDLNTSRPYLRAVKRQPSARSQTSSAVISVGWSYFSGVRLSQVSEISVINLLVSAQELSNGPHYQGKATTHEINAEHQPSAEPSAVSQVVCKAQYDGPSELSLHSPTQLTAGPTLDYQDGLIEPFPILRDHQGKANISLSHNNDFESAVHKTILLIGM